MIQLKTWTPDVISIEAARSDFTILLFLKEHRFKLEIGPGIYDIHSPRIPPREEMEGYDRTYLGIYRP